MEGGIPDPSTLEVSDDDVVGSSRGSPRGAFANMVMIAVEEGTRESTDRTVSITTTRSHL